MKKFAFGGTKYSPREINSVLAREIGGTEKIGSLAGHCGSGEGTIRKLMEAPK